VSRSAEFTKKLEKIREQNMADRIDVKIAHLVKAIMNCDNPDGLPEPLNKPSKVRHLRRANVHENLEIYWKLENGVLYLVDIGDHTLLKKYGDAMKSAR